MSELKAFEVTRKALFGRTCTEKVYFKSEADRYIAHIQRKRCEAMASKCRLRARWFGDNSFYKKEQWALQWHRRWMELAEKFKEAK